MLIDIKVPVLAESVAEATLMTWHKRVGDPVKRGDNLIDIETDKVTLEVSALNDGVIAEILKDDGAVVQSDEVIARINTEAPIQPSLPEINNQLDDSPKLSPAVRHLLAEHQLDASAIKTDSDRITKQDVVKHIKNSALATTPSRNEQQHASMPDSKPAKKTVVAAKTTDVAPAIEAKEPVTPAEKPESTVVPILTHATEGRLTKKVPMTRLRQRVAERLLGAQHDNAILTTFNEVNMHPIMTLRSKHKDEFEKTHGVKLGFMSFFARASIEALKKFPIINASIDEKHIVYHEYFDIGIAISAPRGLVVPIIRDADSLSLADIEKKIRDYGERARDNTLMIDDLTGGTFTITNGGVFGSLLSTPIINPPQSAILGMHAIKQRPIAEDNQVVIRPMMYLALSYDHRIIDGREAVQFLVSIKQQLEDPERLLLQL